MKVVYFLGAVFYAEEHQTVKQELDEVVVSDSRIAKTSGIGFLSQRIS